MLERSLRHTLEKNEMILYYQPVIDLKGKKIVCAEDLVRWKHPERGLMRPHDFISIAEGIGFISSLDEWVLRTACGQAKNWPSMDSETICLTVNISRREFNNPEFVYAVRQILGNTGFDSRCLELEISEQTAIDRIEDTARKVHQLRGAGIRLAIDHFGAGYFSINNLRLLCVNRIKIDKSFIQGVGSSQDDRALIKAMIAMAHTLNITVVAEGVESREQMHFLEANECDQVQGHLVCGPIPADEFAKFAASYGQRSVQRTA